MQAALRIIGRAGVDGVTHRSVAAEAGLSVGAVTHHFRTRDELVDAALRFAVTREVGRLRTLALELQTKAFDTRAWTQGLAAWYARDLARDPETHIACYEAFLAGARQARYRPLVREWFDTYHQSAGLALRAAGSKRPDEHAQVFVAALMGLVQQQLAQPRRDFQQTAAAALATLVAALVGRK
jgi:DNA-binding transcriptional regulator YbjK